MRLSMKAGYHVDPLPFARTQQRRMASPARPRVARGQSRVDFFGYVVSNTPDQGQMVVDVRARNKRDPHLRTTVLYKNIAHISRWVTGFKPIDSSSSTPGSQAFGVIRPREAPLLIPVLR